MTATAVPMGNLICIRCVCSGTVMTNLGGTSTCAACGKRWTADLVPREVKRAEPANKRMRAANK